jgi:hypothetical protein
VLQCCSGGIDATADETGSFDFDMLPAPEGLIVNEAFTPLYLYFRGTTSDIGLVWMCAAQHIPAGRPTTCDHNDGHTNQADTSLTSPKRS